MGFSDIPEILEELRAGRMIVLVDDEDRENEGDLVCVAEKVTPEIINFMAQHGRGLICLAVTAGLCDKLNLHPQTLENTATFKTAFTVSIDARDGISTGISAGDRAHTIRQCMRDDCKPEDLARPGHVFPLKAKPGGVLVRAGQTEGSVDLARLAGLKPAGVICEIMNPDGTMARVPQLEVFCREHNIKMTSIARLIEYRFQREPLVQRVDMVDLPTDFGDFRLIGYQTSINIDSSNGTVDGRAIDDSGVSISNGVSNGVSSGVSISSGRSGIDSDGVSNEADGMGNAIGSDTSSCANNMHLALCKGDVGMLDAQGRVIQQKEPVLVRVHSECLTGDVFHSQRCDCGKQLAESMRMIDKAGKGAVIYLRQEGRGIGLAAKLHAYHLQQVGMDTVQANEWLGFKADKRDYGLGAQICRDLGISKVANITNNPIKTNRLQLYGITVVKQVPLQVGLTEHNYRYLKTKRDKMGHLLDNL